MSARWGGCCRSLPFFHFWGCKLHGNSFSVGRSRRSLLPGGIIAFIFLASLSPLLAQCTDQLPQVFGTTNSLPSLPPYASSLKVVFPILEGGSSQTDQNQTVSVDYVYHTSQYGDVHAVVFSKFLSLHYSIPDGGFLYLFNPGDYATSYNTLGQCSIRSVPSGCAYTAFSLGVAPYYTGLTLFKIHDANGSAVQGANIEADNYARSYGNRFNTLYPALAPGKTTMLLGRGLFVSGDYEYPNGLASDDYLYYITAPGMSAASVYFSKGSDSGGQTADVTLTPSHSSFVLAPTTAADNPDKAPGSTGGAGGGSVFDLDAFFKRLSSFFFDPATAKPALAALKVSSDKLTSWGPFGLPAQLQAQFTQAQEFFTHTPSTDPDYWVFPSFGEGPIRGDVYSQPDDFNPSAPVASPTYTPGMWDRFSWSGLRDAGNKLDLRPYAYFILFGRYFVLCVTWLKFLIELRNRMTPEVKV